jgi:hypothetical protein
MNENYSTETKQSPAQAASWEAPVEQPLAQFESGPPVHHAARGFSQAFGLHPIAGITTLAVNMMLFTGELATMGALIPVAFAVAVVLAYVTYKCQVRYGDDHDAALVKAMAVGLLTAIPTSLPSFLTLPSTAVGIIHMLRRKE